MTEYALLPVVARPAETGPQQGAAETQVCRRIPKPYCKDNHRDGDLLSRTGDRLDLGNQRNEKPADQAHVPNFNHLRRPSARGATAAASATSTRRATRRGYRHEYPSWPKRSSH